MKCIAKTPKSGPDAIMRVTDERAAELVKDGWRYVPKSEWKKAERP